jgi:hypothetical protein
MSKFILAIAAASFALGMNASMAKDTPSHERYPPRRGRNFKGR